jgi:outer membrane protein insertion porin family
LFSEEVVKEDVKRLYELGYFSNISVDVERGEHDIKVAFIVKEKPELHEIVFKGNSMIATKRLLREMKAKTGEALNEKLLVEDVESLHRLYAQEGFPLARIEYEVVHPDSEREAVVFVKINEGPKQAIRRIRFAGNGNVSSRRLMQIMQTKRKAPWPLCVWPMTYMFSKGALDDDIFADDLERIRIYYASLGYVDMKIDDVERTASHDGRYIDITVSVKEGDLYQVGEISIEGNKVFESDELQRSLSMSTDATYSPLSLQQDMEVLGGMYFSKGYTDAEIVPEKKLNPDTNKIDICYKIKEYEPYYVGRIDIKGNTRTKDKVIRRELNIMPGDVFDNLKIQRSRERLENTGFFDSVEVTAAPGEGAQTRNLEVDVKEGRTGQLSFGAGYSSIDSFVGFAEISQSNFDIKNFPYFTGGGQKIRLRAEVGTEVQDFALSFTEPYFLGRKLSAGFDLYATSSQYLSDYYDEQRVGGALRLGRAFGEFIRGDIAYKLENVTLDVDDDASEYLLSQDGSNVISSINMSLTRDTRDSITFPRSGAISGVTFEFAGLGGDTDFVKLEWMGTQYFVPIERFPNHVVRVAGAAGVASSYGTSGDVPLSERFFLGGGNTIRGFEFRDVGPKDEYGAPIGGDSMAMGSFEYTFPLISRIRGAAFFDFGNVYETPGDFLSGIVASVGMGVRLNLPVGPIKLDYGIPIITDEWTEGETGAFSFNVGTIF